METPTQRWSALLVLLFFTVVIFLFFHLYLRPPSSNEDTEPMAHEATLEVPTVGVINPMRGPEDATVTIVEFGDFQCEHCRDIATSLDTLRKEFPEDLRVVWKDFPNESLHNEATPAAIAARCAGEQGGFWTYHDLLFTQINLLGTNTYTAVASTIGLDVDVFNRCVSRRTPLPLIQRDFEEGLALSITATPTIFVNNERFVGNLTTDRLREIIQSKLP